jgi:formyltetrahydrofolate-dependent phosphoribosylglycinamide formyltransferase
MRIGVLLSGGGRTLENFFEKIHDQTLDAVVAVVVSSHPKAFGLVRAKNHLVPHCVVRREDFENTKSFSQAITSVLDGARVDLVLMAGFLKLYAIPPRYEGRVINIHPALIPKFCGKGFYGHHVHEAVIEAKEKESGCTVHFADNEYDHGPIILQRKVEVLEGDTPDDLADRVFEQECIAFPEAIRMFIQGEIGPKAQ